jgi:hypothetical protein
MGKDSLRAKLKKEKQKLKKKREEMKQWDTVEE